jgi:hypothetical protein
MPVIKNHFSICVSLTLHIMNTGEIYKAQSAIHSQLIVSYLCIRALRNVSINITIQNSWFHVRSSLHFSPMDKKLIEFLIRVSPNCSCELSNSISGFDL